MTTTPTPTPAAVPPRIGPPKELLSSTSFLLKRLGWVIKDRSHAAVEPIGLMPQHHAVLSVLGEGACGAQGTIADALGYDRSQLVGLLDELEERGYVKRRRDPGDRRRHLVSITPDGAEALAKLRTISSGVQEEFLEPLDEEERRTLHALLLRLAAHHDLVRLPTPPA
jgi:DNA-binding MarR family transcriptional regulator